MGVGQSTIDLSKLTVTGGRLNAGVGTTDLTLPAKGRFTMSIDGGVGTVRIHLPVKMALRVEVDTGIGSFNPGSRCARWAATLTRLKVMARLRMPLRCASKRAWARSA